MSYHFKLYQEYFYHYSKNLNKPKLNCANTNPFCANTWHCVYKRILSIKIVCLVKNDGKFCKECNCHTKCINKICRNFHADLSRSLLLRDFSEISNENNSSKVKIKQLKKNFIMYSGFSEHL